MAGYRVTDFSSVEAVDNLPKDIREIEFEYLNIFTPALSGVIKYCTDIEKIRLCSCQVYDDGLSEIGKLEKLKSISIYDCGTITDRGISNLLQENRKIEEIVLVYCPKLTNASLFTIAANCPSLRSIEVKNAEPNKITVEGTREIISKCENLVKMTSMSRTSQGNINHVPMEIDDALRKRLKTNGSGTSRRI